MSAYLTRLKQLDGGRNSFYVPDTLPPKPPEAPFAGFDGMGTGHIEKIFIDKDVLVEAVKNGGTAWMWQIILLEKSLIVSTSPASTMAEMVETYPDAINIEVIE